jgi:cell division protein FtsB
MVVAELGLTLSDAIILAAVLGAGLKVLADYRGWTRSPALVRQENADLRERNATLEADVNRLDAADREKAAQIAALEARIEELQKRDQAAVLDAIAKHDESMVKLGEVLVMRGDEHERNVQARADQQRAEHAEAMNVWQEILGTLVQTANKEAER